MGNNQCVTQNICEGPTFECCSCTSDQCADGDFIIDKCDELFKIISLPFEKVDIHEYIQELY